VLRIFKTRKKNIRDFTDADIERLYDEWEENDEDKLSDDEKAEHPRSTQPVDFENLKKMSNSPDDLLKMSKKGQPVMMFVNLLDKKSPRTTRSFTDHISSLWQSNLYNNHVDVQVYTIEDDRLLFMFKDGSQAWESRDFILKQSECKEIVLEGQTLYGPAASNKEEL